MGIRRLDGHNSQIVDRKLKNLEEAGTIVLLAWGLPLQQPQADAGLGGTRMCWLEYWAMSQ
jgi:hypothetical protein